MRSSTEIVFCFLFSVYKSLSFLDSVECFLLGHEYLYVELIQWINCDTGNVLATFKTNLSELLYPPTWNKGCAIGVDVDLLMDATRKFPVRTEILCKKNKGVVKLYF